ncbi:FAD-binding oxidoreductase [Achromobacter xylosoxidans]
MTHAAPERLPLRVHALRRIAENIIELDLRGEGRAPAPIEAGAHLDLHLPGGLTRSYSLTNPGDASGRYVLAVALDAASRGGSAYIHARLRPGDTLQASGPRNHFPLAPGAAPASSSPAASASRRSGP